MGPVRQHVRGLLLVVLPVALGRLPDPRPGRGRPPEQVGLNRSLPYRYPPQQEKGTGSQYTVFEIPFHAYLYYRHVRECELGTGRECCYTAALLTLWRAAPDRAHACRRSRKRA